MKIHSSPARRYDFYFPDLDTLVRVESSPEGVTIRASRNSFSDQRKRSFIHELAAEGFIPEDFEWRSLGSSELSRGVRWLIDFSWLNIDASALALADRAMYRLIGGAFVLWVVLMSAILLRPAG